ncbi:MAG: NfeD family protein [Breznakibacter sp.]
MSAMVIVLLILVGIILLIIEWFMIPGITIAGIAGALFVIGGVVVTYQSYGASAGHWALFGTLVSLGLMLYISFRTKTWDRLALKSSIDSAVETVEEEKIAAGDKGMAVSRLNPVGKCVVNGTIVEAQCPGQFINENEEVEVVKVFKTHIIVKPIN